MPGTPQQQQQSSSVPTGSHLLQLQAPLPSASGGGGAVTPSGLSMGASNQSLGVSVGAASSVSGISITPPNSAGLRQSTGELDPLFTRPPLCVVSFSLSPPPPFNVTYTRSLSLAHTISDSISRNRF